MLGTERDNHHSRQCPSLERICLNVNLNVSIFKKKKKIEEEIEMIKHNMPFYDQKNRSMLYRKMLSTWISLLFHLLPKGYIKKAT